MKKYILPWVVALLLGGGMYAAQATQEWAGCKYLTGVAGVAITCPDTVGRGGATISGGGGGGVIGSGVTGGTPSSVLFIDSSGNLAQDANLVYDPTDLTGSLYFQTPSACSTACGSLALGATSTVLDWADFTTVYYSSLIMETQSPGTIARLFSRDSSSNTAQAIAEVNTLGFQSARLRVDSTTSNAGVLAQFSADGAHTLLTATNAAGSVRVFTWPPLSGETSTVDIMSSGDGARPARLQFFEFTDTTTVSLEAPAAITPRTGGALELRLPGAAPAASGQPIVGTLDGDGVHVNLSFAAGITGTKTVRDSAGTGTCTLIFTGGVLTGGTC